jgi:hypothetical protein
MSANVFYPTDYEPRAAVGHMPFPGHRTQAAVRAQQEAAKRRDREREPFRKAMEYGFDPDTLKASEK